MYSVEVLKSGTKKRVEDFVSVHVSFSIKLPVIYLLTCYPRVLINDLYYYDWVRSIVLI